MTEAPAPVVDQEVRRCNGCNGEENHPKEIFYVGDRPGWGDERVYHPLDHDKDGYVEFHFDCLEGPWLAESGTDPAHIAAAKAGTHGDELRALIKATGPNFTPADEES